MKNYSLLLTTIFAITLCGCTTGPKVSVVNDNNGAKAAEVELAKAANSVSNSLQELAAIEQATHPQARIPSPTDPDAICMGQLASIDWSGPIGPLVKKIADATHYRLHILGNAPPIPILVTISAHDIPLADILRDAGFQCGNKANIVVYPASRIIELRYVKT